MLGQTAGKQVLKGMRVFEDTRFGFSKKKLLFEDFYGVGNLKTQ